MQAISTEVWNMETIYSWDPDTVTETNGFLHNICKCYEGNHLHVNLNLLSPQLLATEFRRWYQK